MSLSRLKNRTYAIPFFFSITYLKILYDVPKLNNEQ